MNRTFLKAIVSLLMLFAAVGVPATGAQAATAPVAFTIDGPLYPGWSVGVTFTGGDQSADFQIRGLSKVTNNKAHSPAPTITVPRVTKPDTTYKLDITQNGKTVATYYAYVGNFYPNITPRSYYVPTGYQEGFAARGFMPGETVDLFLDGSKTGVSVDALTAFAPNYAFNYQGQILPGMLNYTIPANLAGKSPLFELRGRESHVATQARITVAQSTAA